jgi:uncharacterized protein (DUF362 family)
MSTRRRREFLKEILAAGTCGAMSSFVSASAPRGVWAAEAAESANSAPARWAPVDPPNRPIGQPKGIFPGRVVWIHDPSVVQWDGDTQIGGWFEDKSTDPALADQMVSGAVRILTGAKTDSEAWKAMFQHFNRTRGRGDAGYRPGEKIAVKLNLNCSQQHRTDFKQGLYNTPQVTMALLQQLVKHAGVRPTDIVVYDASRFVNDSIFIPANAESPGIRFEDRDGGDGRFKIQPDRHVALRVSDPATPMYLPTCVTSATYLINVGLLKGHSLAGVTLVAKNHFGSVYRENTGPRDPHKGWNPSNMHGAILTTKRPMGTYNALVDVMGHKDLGGKTMLYLIDALYASPHQSMLPEKWESSPFGGHWTASVFACQDPVAIESVAVDFFAAENTAKFMVGSVDNYLHEAALAHRPPSRTCYDPEGSGTALGSLGVHEHWNSPAEKQYSRNLGTGSGIELVKG